MKKFFAVVFILLAVVSLARADYYIKSKSHTDAMSMMGRNQPAKDEINEQWIGGDKFAYITPDTSIILDLKANMGWIVNYKDKTYVETTLPLDMAKLAPPEAQALLGMMKATVSVQPTNETKAVGQWACTGYNVSIKMMMGSTKFSVWATDKVPFNLALYQDKMFPNLMKGMFRLDEASVAEMEKIKGFWISYQMSMEMMGLKITSEVVEISKKTPGPEVYAIPAGYTKSQYTSMR